MERIQRKLTILTVLVGLALLLSVLTFASNLVISAKCTGAATVEDAPTVPTNTRPTQPTGPIEVSEDDDPVKGDKDAPVTIIEFSDYECAFCGRYSAQTYHEIIEKYVDTGKAKYVFRDFPLGFHQNAQKAAEASECADDQGKFWEYHDILFLNQGALSINDLKGYASDLSLDTSKFDSCLDSGKYASEVRKDLADGGKAGISGTPSFIINGQKLVGAQPFSAFEQAIEAALAA